MNSENKSLRSGELARLAKVSPDTIRYYERMGLLPKPPRTTAGYRLYASDSLERVHLVQRALQLGFTLKELAEILRIRDSGGAPCHRVLSMTEGKLRSLDQQIHELQTTERYMRQIVRQWRTQLKRTAPGSTAMLLQSLTGKTAPRVKPTDNLKRR